MGPPGACLSISASSSLLHLPQAVLGLELLLHLPPLHYTPCAPSMHLPQDALCCPLSTPVPRPPHTLSQPSSTVAQKLMARGSGVFPRQFVSPSNEPCSHPALLAVTSLVTALLPWCQGMFSAIKVTSMLFPCVLSRTQLPAWLWCLDGCSWQ